MNLTDALMDYQRRQETRKPAKAPWSPPSTFKTGYVLLSLDQTLSNTGWVIFWVDVTGRVRIVDRGTIRPVSERQSFMETFHKTRQFAVEVEGILRTDWAPRIDGLVFEMPAVGGWRTESSLLAASECVRLAEDYCFPYRVMSSQHARAVMCGPGKSNDKSAMQEAMKPLCEGSRWNEHQRDGLGNGLVQLHELNEKGESAWTEPLRR